jgi:hypothetical protein
MIPTPKDLLTTWVQDWTNDLETNLAEQARLKEDELRIRAILDACARAGDFLFPPDPAPEGE